MYKHRLASLFDPSSMLVISDIDLPLSEHIPTRLQHHVEWLHWDDAAQEEMLTRPGELEATTNKSSPTVTAPDLALICLSSKKITLALQVLTIRQYDQRLRLPFSEHL